MTFRRKFRVPNDVKMEAQKGLDMHNEGFLGGTITGWNRAKQLIKCESVSDSTIRTMKAWFARHSYTSQPGYRKWVKNGKPVRLTTENKRIYRGAVAWLIWGGDHGKKWVNEIEL